MDDGLAALAAKDLGIVASCLTQTKASAGRVMARLVESGAAAPEGNEKPPVVPDALKDTPANRQYLECLRLTLDAAKLVDEERGTGDKEAAVARQIHLTEKEIFGIKV